MFDLCRALLDPDDRLFTRINRWALTAVSPPATVTLAKLDGLAKIRCRRLLVRLPEYARACYGRLPAHLLEYGQIRRRRLPAHT